MLAPLSEYSTHLVPRLFQRDGRLSGCGVAVAGLVPAHAAGVLPAGRTEMPGGGRGLGDAGPPRAHGGAGAQAAVLLRAGSDQRGHHPGPHQDGAGGAQGAGAGAGRAQVRRISSGAARAAAIQGHSCALVLVVVVHLHHRAAARARPRQQAVCTAVRSRSCAR